MSAMTPTTDHPPAGGPAPLDDAAPLQDRAPLRLSKHHGLGNDFLIALGMDNPDLVPSAQTAHALCDRHRGIGADGVLWGLDPLDPANDLSMVLHNADGSVAEISGNGIRCLGQAVLRHRGERRRHPSGHRKQQRSQSYLRGGVRLLRAVPPGQRRAPFQASSCARRCKSTSRKRRRFVVRGRSKNTSPLILSTVLTGRRAGDVQGVKLRSGA